ncbi:MAG: hypothetical protein ACPH4I_01335 [Flavobacteriaceae bacterium]
MKEYAFYLALSLTFVYLQAQKVTFTEYDLDNARILLQVKEVMFWKI